MEFSPFTVAVPGADVEDLVARIANTRWPSDVAPTGAGAFRRRMPEELADRWASVRLGGPEARLNAFPQFTTTIDGQTIHFVHVRSAVPDATPLLLAHGYPSSFVEFTRMIGPLVDPVAHGGRAEDAFHVVVPSLPGFGFSTPVTRPAGASREPRTPSTRSCRDSGTSGTASTAATSVPASPRSCASSPASG